MAQCTVLAAHHDMDALIPALPHRGIGRATPHSVTLAAALLLVPLPIAASGPGASDAVAVKVSPQTLFEGGAVRTQVRLPPDADNRAMRLEVDGERYFSSSTLQLEGDDAPAVYERRWLDLPAGKYSVQVVIVRASGETRHATAEFTVIDPRAERPVPEP